MPVTMELGRCVGRVTGGHAVEVTCSLLYGANARVRVPTSQLALLISYFI